MQTDETKSPSEDSPANVLRRLLECYGDGSDGSAPTETQWNRVFARPTDAPITLINFFSLREKADYDDLDHDADGEAEDEAGNGAEGGPGVSGAEAMMRYAAISGPSLESVGGRFLLMGPHEFTLMGPDEDWDMVAIGRYPSRNALIALFENEAYAKAYRHRRAAVGRQRVLAVQG